MADKFEPQFTPDMVSEQIDHHLASHYSTEETTSADRIVKVLKQHYVSTQDHSQTLERVWNRFTEQRPPLETVQQERRDQRPTTLKDRAGKRTRHARLTFPLQVQEEPLRRSGLVAAVVFLVLVVGGMVLLPHLLHRSNMAGRQTEGVATTATVGAIVAEQPVYGVLPANGTAYLYKGTKPIRVGQSRTISLSVQFNVHSGKLVQVDSQHGGAKIWSYQGDLFSQPLLADNVLYVPSQSGLDALRASDHTLLWHQNVQLTPYQVSNGMLYAIGQDSGLEALRISDGALLWHSQYKWAWIEDDVIYATENFDYVNALRPSDGSLLWRTQLVDRNLDIARGVIFLHTSSYGIRALNSKTGALLWSNENINTILATQNGFVYAATKDAVVALQANNGQILWQYKVSTVDGILLSNDTAYIGTLQSDVPHVFALHLSDGKFLWQAKTSGQAKLLNNGVLYLDRTRQGEENTLFALKASDGSLLWQRNGIEHLYNSPIQVQAGIVYITLLDNKTIVALKDSDGTILARYRADAL